MDWVLWGDRRNVVEMEEKVRQWATVVLAILAILIWGYVTTLPDGKLHIFFCNVGQGDAIVLRTPRGFEFVIDGGPDNAVLECLAKVMPFYDRTLEGILATHPHIDHIAGLTQVLARYHVLFAVDAKTPYASETYKEYRKAVENEGADFQIVGRGNTIVIDGLQMEGLWPPGEEGRGSRGDKGDIDEGDINDSSIVLLVTYGKFSVLLPGDAGSEVLEGVMKVRHVTVLKVSHHGSRTGLSDQLLSNIAPTLAVISSGADNAYGHPHPEVLGLIAQRQIPLLRTDIHGTIEITTDGERWEVNHND